jgi:hypothetical protein
VEWEIPANADVPDVVAVVGFNACTSLDIPADPQAAAGGEFLDDWSTTGRGAQAAPMSLLVRR